MPLAIMLGEVAAGSKIPALRCIRLAIVRPQSEHLQAGEGALSGSARSHGENSAPACATTGEIFCVVEAARSVSKKAQAAAGAATDPSVRLAKRPLRHSSSAALSGSEHVTGLFMLADICAAREDERGRRGALRHAPTRSES